jgi:hypothetical protein
VSRPFFCQIPGPKFSSPVPDPDLTLKQYQYILCLNCLLSKIPLKMELIFIRTSVSDPHSFAPDTANFSMRIRSRIQGANRMRVRADPDPGLLNIKFWCYEVRTKNTSKFFRLYFVVQGETTFMPLSTKKHRNT